MKLQRTKTQYKNLLKNIGQSLSTAKSAALQQVNNQLVKANWEIGRHIVEFEQQGQERAEYGSALLTRLSDDLKLQHGKGFGRRNLLDMRRFYLAFQNWRTVSAKLSWSHYIALVGVTDKYARQFYLKQATNENLSVRELERQIDSSLFERLALSRDKKGVMKLAAKGNIITSAKETLRDPYVFDFLGIAKLPRVSEKMLEQKLIDNLQQLLLELGKGFTFVARQFKFSLRNKHYYIDLVFYHRILRCFVLIDLKAKKVGHQDIGQMNLYLNYLKQKKMLLAMANLLVLFYLKKKMK